MTKVLPPGALALSKSVLVAGLVLLATVAGVMAGGQWQTLALLSIVGAGLGLWAARHDWLVRPEENAPPAVRLRRIAVIAASAFLAILYVALTGGRDSPLSFALYLPLVLAAICFGVRAGLTSGLGMALVYAFGLGWRDPHHLPLPSDWECVISFPLVAGVVSLLTRRNEERLHALYTTTQDQGALLDMSQMMDAAIDLEMTLNLILLNVQKLSGCQVCAVYLRDSAGETLELRGLSGPRDRGPLLPFLPVADACGPGWYALGDGLGSHVTSGRACDAFYADDTRALERAQATRLLDLDPRARSFACLPLSSLEGMLGLLYVGYDLPGGLRHGEVSRLEQLAARAAFPLQRALLQQDFQALAYTDAMTGLDNYRQFERALQDEMRRAERYGRPLSLLMLDVDHFKAVNDTLGHPAGDALLAQLATVLRNALRAVDHPARYGGEEFVVICPETGKEEARLVAERVRHAVAETPFVLTDSDRERGERPLVTVSVGFATYPHDARAAADLIKYADTALYAAKDAGRNVVRGHGEAAGRVLAA